MDQLYKNVQFIEFFFNTNFSKKNHEFFSNSHVFYLLYKDGMVYED